jgi:NitT/TauT family transport system ATP-binding protein
MIGLLEVLEDFNGRVDAAKVADDLLLELDDLLPAVDAAELLGFLKVVSGDLILTDEGKRFLSKGSSGRKRMLNKILSKTPIFKSIIAFVKQHEDAETTKDDVIDFLRRETPDLEAETTFRGLVEWGRYSLLFRYDSNSGKIKVIRPIVPQPTALQEGKHE